MNFCVLSSNYFVFKPSDPTIQFINDGSVTSCILFFLMDIMHIIFYQYIMHIIHLPKKFISIVKEKEHS